LAKFAVVITPWRRRNACHPGIYRAGAERTVRYVINTHSHADHLRNCFLPGATIISHQLCREFLETRGQASLEEVRKQNISYRNVKIVLPHLTFNEGTINLRVGKKSLIILPLPGHARDNIAVLVEEDRVLFAGDAAMPVPYIVEGDIDELTTLERSGKWARKCSSGYGDILLGNIIS
jgi:glyoxylase-like metal-dependent hydrolase (beta-lactamase superfamily II)